jgi:hypothetical protein
MPTYIVSVSAREIWEAVGFTATCEISIGSKFVSHKKSAGDMTVIFCWHVAYSQ